jgi:xanthine dehydrogenase YagT iron-sulfur-binding subunit
MTPSLTRAATGAATSAAQPAMTPVTLRINGAVHQLTIDLRATLLDTLRERLGFTGAKKGCDRGECGACTAHINGRRINACMTLAVMHEGQEITTIEGLEVGETVHPVQAAFIEHDALQCGYCTPGQIMSAVACIREGHAGSMAEIREWMSGNLCRCSAYPNIVAAVHAAAQRL